MRSATEVTTPIRRDRGDHTSRLSARRFSNVNYDDAVPVIERHQDLRNAIRDLCGAFPDSYWRELILSESPIGADPLSTPWLPATYDAGAAVRLHFRWPFAVPFTEVVLRPFSRYPVQVLQTVWDNRKSPVQNRAISRPWR